MRAAVLYEPKTPLVVEDLDLLPPRANEVLVRLASAGVCRSDHHFMAGHAPFPTPVVLGHEGAAIVEELGPSVSNLKVGDPVILSFVPNCGFCHFCTIGRPYLCDVGSVARGGLMDGTTRLRKGDMEIYQFAKLGCFGQYAVVPESACIKLPQGFPLDQAALMGCSVPTGVGAVINTAQVEAGSTVAVVGCGGVGLNIIQGARLVNAGKIIAVDISDGALKMAERFGATDGVNSSKEDPVARVRELTGGLGADYTFESFGSATTAKVAYEAARKAGTVTIVGLAPVGESVSIDLTTLTRMEKIVRGCYYGSARPHVDFPKLTRLVQEGKLDLAILKQRSYGLDQVNEAYEDLENGLPGRGVIVYE
ncbi:MAG: S-(hydroxymethyl)glutathione dehydrogenase / alcohol dehydrogenase [Chloroflexi bacterium]|jgi:S-(hydroxymethyl)glutathione dehydrogenase/alcohol dehydrogenase|nr:MAG: S-(hydroxymethyl)glutathione dehydrogenase / alcohol dehydrogenase [Chloroflexota bacterium]